MPMQIFAKWQGRTVTLEVDGSDTIAAVAAIASPKLGIPADRIGFMMGTGGTLPEDQTLAQLGIEGESTLQVVILNKIIREDVCAELRGDLDALLEHLENNYIIFIGVGSFDNGHKNAAVLKRQQCRDALLEFCKRERFGLTILLIDPGFQPGNEDPAQIYDVAAQGWINRPVATFLNGQVRHYRNTLADITGRDCHIVTYGTGIIEYDPLKSITNKYHIAGWKLIQFMVKIKQKKVNNVCVISGNFFNETPNKDQFTTMGDPAIIAECGFTPNL
ncbi:Hypothetical protein A7982_03267 [Minicystis rosea]|nr:Hypothetical protein A7982_03267 [Minicystis rosea]